MWTADNSAHENHASGIAGGLMAPQDRQTITAETQAAPEEPSMLDAALAATVRGNTLLSAFNYDSVSDSTAEERDAAAASGWNPYTYAREHSSKDPAISMALPHMLEDGVLDEVYSERQFKEVVTAYQAEAKRIQAEDSSTVGGILGGLVGALLDPVTYIPVAGAASKAKNLGMAGKAAFGMAAGAGGAAISEIGLQQTQHIRTVNESLMAIGTAGFLGGGIGAAAGYFAPTKLKSNTLHPDNPNNPLRPENLDSHPHVIRQGDYEDTLSPDDLAVLRGDADNLNAARVEGREELTDRDTEILRKDPKTPIGKAWRWTGDHVFNNKTIIGRVSRAHSPAARRMGLGIMDMGGVMIRANMAGKAARASAETLKDLFMVRAEGLIDRMRGDIEQLKVDLTKAGTKVKDKSLNKDVHALTQRTLMGLDDAELNQRLTNVYGEEGFARLKAAAQAQSENIHRVNQEFELDMIQRGALRNVEEANLLKAELKSAREEMKKFHAETATITGADVLARKVATLEAKKFGPDADPVKVKEHETKLASARADLKKAENSPRQRSDQRLMEQRVANAEAAYRAEMAKPMPMGRDYGHAQLWNRDAFFFQRDKAKAFLRSVLAKKPDADWLMETRGLDLEDLADLKNTDRALYDDILEDWAGNAYYQRLDAAERNADATADEAEQAMLDLNDTLRERRLISFREGQLDVSKARKVRDALAAKHAERQALTAKRQADLRLYKHGIAMADRLAKGPLDLDGTTKLREMLDQERPRLEEMQGHRDAAEAHLTASEATGKELAAHYQLLRTERKLLKKEVTKADRKVEGLTRQVDHVQKELDAKTLKKTEAELLAATAHQDKLALDLRLYTKGQENAEKFAANPVDLLQSPSEIAKTAGARGAERGSMDEMHRAFTMAQTKVKRLAEKRDAARAKLEAAQARMDELKSELELATKAQEEVQGRYDAINADLGHTESRTKRLDLEGARARLDTLNTEVSSLRDTVDMLSLNPEVLKLGGKDAADKLRKVFAVDNARYADLERQLKHTKAAQERATELVAQMDDALNTAAGKLDAATSARKALDDTLEDLHKQGLVTAKNAKKAKRELSASQKAKPIDQMVDDVYDQFTKTGSMSANAMEALLKQSDRQTGRTKQRSIHLSPEERMEALKSGLLREDLPSILYKQYEEMSADLSLRESLGYGGKDAKYASFGDRLNEVELDYQDMVNDAKARGDDALAQKLAKESKIVIDDLVMARDRVLGNVMANDGTTFGWANWLSSKVRAWNFMRWAGGFAISSATDLAAVTLHNGSYFKTMKRYGKQAARQSFSTKARQEAGADGFAVWAASMDMGLQAAGYARRFGSEDLVHDHNGSHGIGYGTTRKVTGAVDKTFEKGTEIAGNLSLLPQINRIHKVAVAHQTAYDLNAKLKNFDSLPPLEQAKLASLGIGRKEAARLAKQMELHGKLDGYVFSPNLHEWPTDDHRLFIMAVQRNINRSIPSPSVGDTPRLLSTWWGKTWQQFMTFAYVFQNKWTYSTAQRLSYGDRTAAKAVGVLAGAALFVVMAKEAVKGKDPTELFKAENLPKLAYDIVDRSGILGWTSPYTNAAMTLTGATGASRYQQQGALGGLLGINYSLPTDISSTLYALKTGDDGAALKALSLMPFAAQSRMISAAFE